MTDRKFFMDILKQLVAIPSVSQNEEACAVFLTKFLKEELGLDTVMHRVEGKSCNVTAALRGIRGKGKGEPDGRGRTLLLGGHLDTVSAGTGWSSDPLELKLEGDRVYGLGSADMKGGLAAQITVLKRLADEGADFKGQIELAALCDEERHSIGANAYAAEWKDRAAKGEALPGFAIFGEPHYDNIVVGATGKMLLKLTVTGRAGHAANPETGVNAIDCMIRFLNGLRDKYDRLYREGDAASHCTLRIESRYEGYSLNIPEECSALLNKQLYVHENAEAFIEDLRGIYERTVGKGELTITREVPCYPSYQLDRENGELRRLLRLLDESYGFRPELRLNQSVSDGNILYHELDIPTVLFGPEGHNYHKPNEYMVLSSAYRYMDMLYDFITGYFAEK